MKNDSVKVKLLSPRAGHRFDSAGRKTGVFSQKDGDVISLSKADAARLVDKSYAEYANTETN